MLSDAILRRLIGISRCNFQVAFWTARTRFRANAVLIRLSILLALVSLISSRGIAQHSPLLPRPQQIVFGTGRLPLHGLQVRLASDAPADEDRFAAETLVKYMIAREKDSVQISNGDSAEGAIVLKRTGGVDALPVLDEHAGPESRESYRIKITPRGAEVRSPSSAGLFYAVQTLGQLIEGSGGDAMLPEVEIHDWPSLPYRGTLVDFSQGPLSTEQEVKRQIDFLARWKANQYYLYSEVSIELDGYPLLNPEGRLTKDQVRGIIEYARQRHIDVVPSLELFGHLHYLLTLEQYSDLGAVIPHGEELDPRNPKAAALLKDWISQFVKLFPSPFVEVGFDEVFLIEESAKQRGTTVDKLFIEQLSSVATEFQRHGKRVMAAGDIMVWYPEIISHLPMGLIAVPWFYDPAPDPEYKHWLGPLVEKKVPYVICTAVDFTTGVTPNFSLSFENIDTFLAAGRKSDGLLGLMNTVWGDDAQMLTLMLMRMSWPGMAYGAAAPWQSQPMDRKAFFSEYTSIVYPPAVGPEVASALQALAESEAYLLKLRGPDDRLEFWSNPFDPDNLKRVAAHRNDIHRSRLLAEEAQAHLSRALEAGGDPTMLSSLLFGSRMLDYAGARNLNALEIKELWDKLEDSPSKENLWNLVIYQAHGRVPEFMYASSELREMFRSEWLAEYTPYRLHAALGMWDAEYEFWRRLEQRLRVFYRSFRSGDKLPRFESLIPPD
ncbi:MAG: glycoside hydrolase family 20 zincin-like fold domain-containing protein [Candidatus Sulfotelmatobacter sp.]